jgi:hypothetical protein
MSSSARYRLEYWVARAFAVLIRLLPLRVGWLMGAALGQLADSEQPATRLFRQS